MKAQLKTFRKGRPVCHPCGERLGNRKGMQGGIISKCLMCGDLTEVHDIAAFNLSIADFNDAIKNRT